MNSKLTSGLTCLKDKIVYLSIKIFIDFLISFQVFIRHEGQDIKNTKIKAHVFMVVCKRDFFISIASILSAKHFLKGLDFQLVYDGKPNRLQKILLSKLKISLFTNKQFTKVRSRLSQYPHLSKFYDHDWQGKKFLIPLMFPKKTDKVLVLDSDTLFFDYPKEILAWITRNRGSYFLEDCGNYVLVSNPEAKEILKSNPIIKNVNTGLLLLNLDAYWKTNNLAQINKYIYQIINLLLDRSTDAYLYKDKFDLARHFLEQTLYFLTLSKTDASKLPEKYFVFSKHLYNNQTLKDPILIHFAGESNKKSMYRYLFGSFIEKVMDTLTNKLKNSKPWYIYSSTYCYRCWHTNKNL